MLANFSSAGKVKYPRRLKQTRFDPFVRLFLLTDTSNQGLKWGGGLPPAVNGGEAGIHPGQVTVTMMFVKASSNKRYYH